MPRHRAARLGNQQPSDAILLTRELIKQRWDGMGVLSMGPGWYEDQYLKTLGKLADGPISFVPWYDPNKKMTKALIAALAKAHPDKGLMILVHLEPPIGHPALLPFVDREELRGVSKVRNPVVYR